MPPRVPERHDNDLPHNDDNERNGIMPAVRLPVVLVMFPPADVEDEMLRRFQEIYPDVLMFVEMFSRFVHLVAESVSFFELAIQLIETFYEHPSILFYAENYLGGVTITIHRLGDPPNELRYVIEPFHILAPIARDENGQNRRVIVNYE